MAVEWYCALGIGCAEPKACKHRHSDGSCAYEYVAKPGSEYNWTGEGPPPRRWTAPNGTLVYRSYSDYYD